MAKSGGGRFVPMLEFPVEGLYSAGAVQDLQQGGRSEGGVVVQGGQRAGDAVQVPAVEQGAAVLGVGSGGVGEEVVGEQTTRVRVGEQSAQRAQVGIGEGAGTGVDGEIGDEREGEQAEFGGEGIGGGGGVGPARREGVGFVQDYKGGFGWEGGEQAAVGGVRAGGEDIEDKVGVQGGIGLPGLIDRSGFFGGDERQGISHGGFTRPGAARDLDARWSPCRHQGRIIARSQRPWTIHLTVPGMPW